MWKTLNNTLSRSRLPGAALYFVVMLLFAAAAAVQGQYVLAGVEFGVTVVLFFVFHAVAARQKREILRYMQSTAASLDTAFKDEMPLPMAIVSISNNEIFWSNEQFNRLTGAKSTAFNQKLEAVLPDFSIRWLAVLPSCFVV